MLATSSVSILNVNDGQTGPQGVSVAKVVSEYRLSNSSTEMTGSGTGYTWSETKPEVPAGKYLWIRERTDLSNNTSSYSDAHCDVVISNLVFDVDQNAQAILSKISQSELSTAINNYDSSTTQTIRDNVSQLTQDLNGIASQVLSVTSTTVDGQTVYTSQRLSLLEQDVDGFKTTVSSTYATKDELGNELGNIKVSGNNLYLIKNQVSGYINSSSGAISNPSSTYKEKTSEYIPVTPGKTYIIQAWATPTQTGQSWLAYQFFTDKNASSKIGSRSAKTGSSSGSGVETTAEGQERLIYKVQAPETAHYLRVSYRQYTDGYCMVEQATLPSEYAIATADLENETSFVRTIAEQTADKFSWIVEDGSTSSSVTYTSNALTAMANQIDLTGKVTFNSMDSTLKNTLNGVKAFTGTCSTDSGGDGVKIVTCADATFSLTSGAIITVTFSKASTDLIPYLNVNSLGAKRISFDGDLVRSENRFLWKAGSVITFRYDGSYWVVLDYKNIEYTSSSTAAATAVKTNNTTVGTFVLCRGTTINVYFSEANTANVPKLNIDGTGEIPIYYKGAEVNSSNKYLWDAGSTFTFTYNGATRWYMTDCGSKIVKDYAQTAVDWVGTNGSSVITAKDIISNWATDATSATTTINGGLIEAHTIIADHLATTAITSSNYERVPSSVYSTTGTFLDLSNGDIHSPTFAVDNTAGMAYIDGAINARYLYLGMSSADLASSGGTLASSGGDIAAIAPVLGSYIYYDGETLMINTENFHIGSDGNVSMSGSINSTSGSIGGWEISENDIHYGMEIGQSGTAYLIPAGSTTSHSIGGSSSISGWTITSGANFGVTNTGALYASDVNISGTVSASSGSIGSWLINPDYLSYGTIGQANSAFLVPAGTLSAYSIGGSSAISGWVLTAGENFGVTNTGVLYASNVNISGVINATSGNIGGFTVINTEDSSNLGFYWENANYLYWCGLRQKGGASSYDDGSIRMFEITRRPISGTGNDWQSQSYIGSDGVIYAMDARLLGGSIGGFTIGTNSMYRGTVGADASIFIGATNYGRNATVAGYTSSYWRLTVGQYFGVTGSGLYATGGKIGGFTVYSDRIEGQNIAIYSGNRGSGTAVMAVSNDSYRSQFYANGMTVYEKGTTDVQRAYVNYSGIYHRDASGRYVNVHGGYDSGMRCTNTNNHELGFMLNDNENGGIYDYTNSRWPFRYSFDADIAMMSAHSYAVRIGAGDTAGTTTFMARTISNAVADGVVYCGASGSRWHTVYSKNGTSTSSDERLKTIYRYLGEDHKKLFMELKPIEYSFNDDLEVKHFGLGAQTTETSMIRLGFDSSYHMVEHSFYDEEDKYGRHDTYNMNYDEAAMLTIPVVQEHEKEIIKLKARITELENKLSQLTCDEF